jgi:hypothetical protein
MAAPVPASNASFNKRIENGNTPQLVMRSAAVFSLHDLRLAVARGAAKDNQPNPISIFV